MRVPSQPFQVEIGSSNGATHVSMAGRCDELTATDHLFDEAANA